MAVEHRSRENDIDLAEVVAVVDLHTPWNSSSSSLETTSIEMPRDSCDAVSSTNSAGISPAEARAASATAPEGQGRGEVSAIAAARRSAAPQTGELPRMRSLPPGYIKHFKSLPQVKVGGERRGSEDGSQKEAVPGTSVRSVERRSGGPVTPSYLKSIIYPSGDAVTAKFFGSSASLYKEQERSSQIDSWVIHPFSRFRMVWTIIMIVILLGTVVILPISVAYFYYDRGYGWLTFNAVSDVFFLVDIVLSFRTGYVDEKSDVIILDSKSIAKNYASKWFILDIIGLLPIDYIFIGLDNDNAEYNEGRPLRVVRVAKLLELFKLLRVTRLFQQTAVLGQLVNVAGAVLGAVRLALMGVLLSHWAACLIVFVPAVQDFPADSWLTIGKIEHASWYEQHFNAWFKTLSFMCGVGYGLITPINMTDLWLSILLMLILSSTYIMLVGYFSSIIMGFDVAGKAYQSFIHEVDEFMIYRKFPMTLRSKIHDYFDFRYAGKMFDEDEVIDELSEPLKKDVIHHTRRNLLLNVPIFSKADPAFVHEVIMVLKHEYFQPGDLIIKAGYSAAKMYFIEKGSVEIYSKEGVLVTRVKQGSYFGEIALMTGCPRTATVRSHSYSKLYTLSKGEFDVIIRKHPEIYRAMALIAIKRMESLEESFPEEHMRLIDIITKNAETSSKNEKRNSSTQDRNGNEK